MVPKAVQELERTRHKRGQGQGQGQGQIRGPGQGQNHKLLFIRQLDLVFRTLYFFCLNFPFPPSDWIDSCMINWIAMQLLEGDASLQPLSLHLSPKMTVRLMYFGEKNIDIYENIMLSYLL